jgi:hypothetical protein
MCFQRVALFVALRCSGERRDKGLDIDESENGVLKI